MKNLAEEIYSVTASAKNASWGCYVQVLTTGLQDLEEIERKAIYLRFWKSMSIEQVAAELKIRWDVADKIIDRSVEKLKGHFAGEDMNTSPFDDSSSL